MSYVSKAVFFYLSNKDSSDNLYTTTGSQLIFLTSNASNVSRAFPACVRNTRDPFFSSMPVNACQIFNSLNQASYQERFSKDGGALKFDAISGSLLSQLPSKK